MTIGAKVSDKPECDMDDNKLYESMSDKPECDMDDIKV